MADAPSATIIFQNEITFAIKSLTTLNIVSLLVYIDKVLFARSSS